jgi:hypothetical protein
VEPRTTPTATTTATSTQAAAGSSSGSTTGETVAAGTATVTDVTGLPDWVRAGYTTSIRTTVVNRGETPVTKALTVTIDGVQVAEKNVTLQPGERRTVPIRFDASPGTVAVEGETVGELSVSERYGEQRGEPPVERGDDDQGSTDQFGAILALLALSGIGAVLWHYRY